MKSWVHYVGDPLPEDIGAPKEVLGGKAASLQDLREAGLPVPPAFVISVDACEFYFQHEETWPPDLDAQVKAHLARLENETGRQFGQGPEPLLLSVRSGAAVSMPGMMDTLLNVGLHRQWADSSGGQNDWQVFLQFIRDYGQTVFGIDIRQPDSTPESLPQALDRSDRKTGETPILRVESALQQFEEEAGSAFPQSSWEILECSINAVFRSWNSERAVQYRRRHRIQGLKGTAVTVQAMFPSRASGIVFTQDPTDPEAGRMVIEASYGLGEAVVSGGTDPDRFIVRREDLSVVSTTPGKKTRVIQALGEEAHFDTGQLCVSEQELHQLCEVSLKVEEHFGQAVDIEFGFTVSELALLQARPIRGLDVALDSEIGREEEIQRLRNLSTERPKMWVVHNIGETLRFPTPLTWDFIRFFMSGAGGFGKMYRDLGYVPSKAVMADGFLELIGGRIYADPDRLAELFWDDLPMVYDRDQVRSDPKVIDQGPRKFDPDRVDAGLLLKIPQAIHSILRCSRSTKQGLKTCHEFFEAECLPPFLEYIRTKRGQDLNSMSTREVLGELDEREHRVLGEFAAESLKPGFFGGLALDQLTQLLGRLDVNGEGQALAFELTLCADDITLEQDALLSKVAHDKAGMQEFLERFGHRCVGEMELMEPRWREDPDYLQRLTESLRGNGFDATEILRRNSERRERALQELPETLAGWGGSSFLEEAVDLAEKARRLLPYRERGKYYLMMGYELIRTAILELSRRWDIGSNVFFLKLNELDQFESARVELLDSVELRKLRWQSLQRLDMPAVIDSSELDDLGRSRARDSADTNRLEGAPVSSGVAEGTAEVVFDPREFDARKTGYILVCPSTDPAWTPLFVHARGLVVERGGILSHGAIVARDFGIPAVVCADATQRIAPASRLRIDGTQGWVDLMEAN